MRPHDLPAVPFTINPGKIPPNFVHSWALDITGTERFKLDFRSVADIAMLSCVMHGGGMTHDTVMQSLRLFAQEVMPAFR